MYILRETFTLDEREHMNSLSHFEREKIIKYFYIASAKLDL